MNFQRTQDTIECVGMCFEPSRVLTEIFVLDSAYERTGAPLGSIDKNFYLQEIARTLSTIALLCRQQMTSYFYQVPDAASTETKDKIKFISEKFVSANEAINAVTANQICPDKGIQPLSFYETIGKICHVEKWTYPVEATIQVFDEEGNIDEGRHLLITVTKRGKTPVTGDTEEILICIPWFIEAARVFVTGCDECSLFKPAHPFEFNESEVCST